MTNVQRGEFNRSCTCVLFRYSAGPTRSRWVIAIVPEAHSK